MRGTCPIKALATRRNVMRLLLGWNAVIAYGLDRMFRALLICLLISTASAAPLKIRVATFNASLNRNSLGQLAADLNTTSNNQARRVAEIIQRTAPDIILVNEFDYDANNQTLALNRFHDNYLALSQNGQPALNYPHRYIAPSNTGVPTGATSPAGRWPR